MVASVLIFTNDNSIVANGFGNDNLFHENAVVSSCDIRFLHVFLYCVVVGHIRTD